MNKKKVEKEAEKVQLKKRGAEKKNEKKGRERRKEKNLPPLLYLLSQKPFVALLAQLSCSRNSRPPTLALATPPAPGIAAEDFPPSLPLLLPPPPAAAPPPPPTFQTAP